MRDSIAQCVLGSLADEIVLEMCRAVAQTILIDILHEKEQMETYRWVLSGCGLY